MELKINPKQFYTIGLWSFLIIAVFNMLNFLNVYARLNFLSKVSTVAGIIFNLALVLFFNYLKGMEPIEETIVKSDDIDKIIKEISKDGKKKSKPKS